MKFDVRFDKKALFSLQYQVSNAPTVLLDYVERTIPKAFSEGVVPLMTEPRLPTLPFVWSRDPVKNARARRWYFANKVKGRTGGRYIRSHRLVNSWKTATKRTPTEVRVSVGNDMPNLEFVQGAQQVPSHQESGWQRYDAILPPLGQKAAALVSQKWLSVLD